MSLQARALRLPRDGDPVVAAQLFARSTAVRTIPRSRAVAIPVVTWYAGIGGCDVATVPDLHIVITHQNAC